MYIQVDNEICDKIFKAINEFCETTGNAPTKITLGNEQYRDLWIITYVIWARKLNSIHSIK